MWAREWMNEWMGITVALRSPVVCVSSRKSTRIISIRIHFLLLTLGMSCVHAFTFFKSITTLVRQPDGNGYDGNQCATANEWENERKRRINHTRKLCYVFGARAQHSRMLLLVFFRWFVYYRWASSFEGNCLYAWVGRDFMFIVVSHIEGTCIRVCMSVRVRVGWCGSNRRTDWEDVTFRFQLASTIA